MLERRQLGPVGYTDTQPGSVSVTRQAGVTSGWSNAPDTTDLGALQWQASRVDDLLLFAKNTANASLDPLADRVASVVWSAGTRTVGSFADGTDTLWVESETSISQVTLSCTRGDTLAVVALSGTLDSVAQHLRLNAATLTALAGGVSSARGDTVAGTYRVASPSFYWTVNTRDVTRFGWSPSRNRWAPLLGGSPELLGTTGQILARIVHPDTWVVGQVLDTVIRVGQIPNENAYPAGYSTTVVVDPSVLDTYVWSLEIAIVSPQGDVRTNPALVVGVSVWFCAQNHASRSGDLGLANATHWLTPTLRPYETPLLRIGGQTYLECLVAPDEASQDLLTLVAGQCSVAQSSGRVLLSQPDLDQLDPTHVGYQMALYGSHLWSDGVAMGTASLPEAQRLTNLAGIAEVVQANNGLYVPQVSLTPGMPLSGVLTIPDGTQSNITAGAVASRPNGTGLVRDLPAGRLRAGDSTLSVQVDRFSANTQYGQAQVSLSDRRVTLSWQDRQRFAGQFLWFQNSLARPKVIFGAETLWSLDPLNTIQWADTCQLAITVSGGTAILNRDPGTESLSAFLVALAAVLTPLGATCGSVNGHLFVEDLGGFVEVGFDPVACKAVGLLPGWRTGFEGSMGLQLQVDSVNVATRERDTTQILRGTRVLVDVPPVLNKWSITPWRYHIAGGQNLVPFRDIVYRDRHAVLMESQQDVRTFQNPVTDLPLAVPLVPESVGAQGGLEISYGDTFASTTYAVSQGNLRLTQQYGSEIASGFRGSVAAGVFSDPDVLDLAAVGIRVGDRIEIGSETSWVVSVLGANATLSPPPASQVDTPWVARDRLDGSPLAAVWRPLSLVQEIPSLTVQHPLAVVPGGVLPKNIPVSGVLVGSTILTAIQMVEQNLGNVGEAITLPTDRLAGQNFVLRVGAVAPNLNAVADLLSEPAPNTVDYLSNGSTRWSLGLLESLSGGPVVYQEIPGQAADGTVEVGDFLAYSSQDAVTYAGQEAWLLEPLGAEEFRINPVSGRVQLLNALPPGARLQVQYRATDTYGTPLGLVDELALFAIDREEALSAGGGVWIFGSNRTPTGTPVVWVDQLPTPAQVNLVRKTITVNANPSQSVRISYLSYVTAGGETNAALTYPVYWGSVELPSGSNTLGLQSVAGLDVGSWLDFGGWLATVTAVGQSSCTFTPATPQEFGVRESGTSPSWFFSQPIPSWCLSSCTLVSATVGQHTITIEEPEVSEYLVLDGQPFQVVSSTPVEAGQKIRLASSLTQVPTVVQRLVGSLGRLGDRTVKGLGPLDALVFWRSEGGVAVLESAQFDPSRGDLQISPLTENTRIAVTGEGPRVLSPRKVGANTLYPRIRVSYGLEKLDNSLLGAEIRACYHYWAPDSYRVQVQTLQDWIVPLSEQIYRLPVVSIPSGPQGSVTSSAMQNHSRVLAGWRAWRETQMAGGLESVINPRMEPLWNSYREGLNLDACTKTSRNLWNLAWNSLKGLNPIWLVPDDPLVETSGVLAGDRLTGPTLSESDLLDLQAGLMVHDLEDQVVPRLTPIRLSQGSQVRPTVLWSGSVSQPYSRVLPSRQRLWGETVSPVPAGRGQTLMPLESIFPISGTVTQAKDRERWGQIVQYAPAGLSFPFNAATFGKPCFVVAVNPSVFPVLADGAVDLAQLFDAGGDILDLTTGDVSPSWKTFAQGSRQPLAIEGLGGLYYRGSVDQFGNPLPLYVCQILDGCVVTVAFDDGTPTGQEVLDSRLIVDSLSRELGPLRGLTLTCQSIDTYQDGQDFRAVVGSQELQTLPGAINPPGAREPLNCYLEGDVPLLEALRNPPLDGTPLNTVGDQPYPHADVVDRHQALWSLDDALNTLQDIFAGKQLYPDPYRISATVLSTGTSQDPPAALLTDQNVLDASRPLANGDLLLVQTDAGSPTGLQGWQEVGLVETCGLGHAIHVPRWVSGSIPLDKIQYTLDNFAYGTGLSIAEVAGETVLTFTGGAEWNDGSGLAIGGLNLLVDAGGIPYPNDNEIILTVFDGAGLVLETVTVQGSALTGALGAQVMVSKPTFFAHTWVLPAIGAVQNLGGGLSYAVSLDCWQAGAGQGSRTGYVDANRVQFHESFDLSFAQPNGAVTPGGVSVETRLDVKTVRSHAGADITVNQNLHVNAGQPLRFKTRPGGIVGTWNGSTGTLTAPSIVKQGGVAISATALPVLALPGNSVGSLGDILRGTGDAGDATVAFGANRITNITATVGDLARVSPGDVVYVDGVLGRATVKQGAYHVHHAVAGTLYQEHTVLSFSGTEGLLSVEYPRVVGYNDTTNVLTVNVIPAVTDENDGQTYSFGSTGRVWLIRDLTAGATANKVVSASYTGHTGNTFTGLADWRDGDGVAVLESVFTAAAAALPLVAGHRWVQVWIKGQSGLADYQTPGYHNPAAGVLQTIGGFRTLTLQHPLFAGVHTWNSTDLSLTPAALQVGVTLANPQPDGGVLLEDSVAIYDGVPRLLDLAQVLNGAAWSTALYGAPGMGTLLPGTQITTTFRAQSGVFLEPSSPRPVLDLGSVNPRVVNEDFSLAASSRGLRNPWDYGGASGLETVRFEVRRVRPHNTVMQQASLGLTQIGTSDQMWRAGVTLQQTTGTGGWGRLTLDRDHSLVSGDVLNVGSRFAQVVSVHTDQTVITTPLPAGVSSVELWRRRPSVEQSWEECLLALGRTVWQGTCQVSTVNQLSDSAVSDFRGLVDVGDLVLIDPAGSLATNLPEWGEGPSGSLGVPGRAGYALGSPLAHDDNRGFYRVLSVAQGHVVVNPLHGYAGSLASPKTFELGDYEYAVLPLVDLEGQNDLRVTGNPVGGSYVGLSTSVPNSYRIIRPDSRWDQTLVDFVLQERERNLTWLDLLGDFTQKSAGTYRDFRKHSFAQLVWAVNRPAVGWVSDEWIDRLRGVVAIGPYLSSAESVSILERRFWTQDPLLEATGPGPNWTDRANGRGGLLQKDRIEILIGEIREERLRWIQYLTNRLNGSL